MIIHTPNGTAVQVSSEDYEHLSAWPLHNRPMHVYISFDTNKRVYDRIWKPLGRAVAERMGLDMSGYIGHIDGDQLNCCRENLKEMPTLLHPNDPSGVTERTLTRPDGKQTTVWCMTGGACYSSHEEAILKSKEQTK